jgi:hypothetical protein
MVFLAKKTMKTHKCNRLLDSQGCSKILRHPLRRGAGVYVQKEALFPVVIDERGGLLAVYLKAFGYCFGPVVFPV